VEVGRGLTPQLSCGRDESGKMRVRTESLTEDGPLRGLPVSFSETLDGGQGN
jgi:hypothetical protein